MFGVGSGEIILILVIAMLVVGPERMVTFARDAGEMLAKFRRETDSVTSEFKEALSLEPTEEKADKKASPAPQSENKESPSTPGPVSVPEPPAPSIAPVASAFADSEVTRVNRVAPTAAESVETTTVLAMPEEESADQVDVYELTVIEGPEVMDDEGSETIVNPERENDR